MAKDLLIHISQALHLFLSRRCLTLAAASSFYLIITIVPLTLLLLRVVGMFLGDIVSLEAFFFDLLMHSFPDATPEIVDMVRSIVVAPLKATGSITIFNIGILVFMSLGFINSLWNGIYLITEDKSLLSWKNYLLGIGVLAFTVFLLISMIIIPPAIVVAINFVTQNEVTVFLQSSINNFDVFMKPLLALSDLATMIVKSYWFYSFFLIFYFIFIYRWLFHNRLRWTGALVSAVTCVIGLVLGKGLFSIYLIFAKTNLEAQYGNYYTFIAALLWILAAMSLFYFGLCIAHTFIGKETIEFADLIRKIKSMLKLK